MSLGHFLTIARVVRAHGVKGELTCEIVTDYPQRFRTTKRVFLGPLVGRQRPTDASKRSMAVVGDPTEIGGPADLGDATYLGDPTEVGASGRAGEPVEVGSTTDPPSPSAAIGPDGLREFVVESARVLPHTHGGQVVLQLAGVADREAAEALRGWLVQVPENEAWKLPRGQYYWHEIIGLEVVTNDGRRLGPVVQILETGANDVYVVKREHGELLLPAIKDVVKKISPERGEMLVELLPGME